ELPDRTTSITTAPRISRKAATTTARARRQGRCSITVRRAGLRSISKRGRDGAPPTGLTARPICFKYKLSADEGNCHAHCLYRRRPGGPLFRSADEEDEPGA